MLFDWHALLAILSLLSSVLYDRLAQVPPSPELNDRQPLPPAPTGPGVPPPHQAAHMGAATSHHHRDVRDLPPADPNFTSWTAPQPVGAGYSWPRNQLVRARPRPRRLAAADAARAQYEGSC